MTVAAAKEMKMNKERGNRIFTNTNTHKMLRFVYLSEMKKKNKNVTAASAATDINHGAHFNVLPK